MVNTNQNSIIATHIKKRKGSKHNIKDSYQITKEENNGRRKEQKELQKQPQDNFLNGNKYIHINNYFKCK